MKRLDNKGSVLLISIMVLYLIIMISVTFFMVNINENNYARQYYHSTEAFWLAEAGINMYINNPHMLDGQSSAQINYGQGTVSLSQDDSQPMFRYVNALAEYDGLRREIQIGYPSNVPDVYHNSLSTNGNVTINGNKTFAVINGQARVSGNFNAGQGNSNIVINDGQQGVDPSLTTLGYPQDPDRNPTDNFINNNRSLIANYAPDQVLYLSNTSSAILTPDQVAGKTIVYVENEEGGGNVTINTSALVAANQKLTIIATGTVTFNQDGAQAPNSQLNIIAWGGYNETVQASSTYHGLIYTHGVATFNKIKADSVTNGGVIADGGIVLGNILSTKIFNYDDMATAGAYPPGFEKLVGASSMGISTQPTLWKEIPL